MCMCAECGAEIVPWTSSDVPIGAIVRAKLKPHTKLFLRKWIKHDGKLCVMFNTSERHVSVDRLATSYVWCWPHEQFEDKWKQCTGGK